MFQALSEHVQYWLSDHTPLPPNLSKEAGSCRPSPWRPTVRLSRNKNRNHASLYGYLPRARDSPDPGYLHLSDATNADLHYILGPSWRSQIVIPPASPEAGNIKENGCSRVNGYSYIPIPQDDLNEAQHCLRMRRCGAKWKSSCLTPPVEMELQQDEYNLRAEMQLFGWPDQGGVWVFRIPRVYLALTDDDPPREVDCGDVEAGLRGLDIIEKEGIGDKMELIEAGIRAQNDMAGVCDVLKNAGGQFYTEPEHCPEVVSLGLLNQKIAKNDWLPPNDVMGEWSLKST